jgi:hypothetical protein
VRVPALALAVSIVLAGCGGGAKRDNVTSDWHAAADAMASGDGQTACRDFTASVSETLSSSSGVSCAEAVKALASPLTPSDRDGVKAVTVKVVALSGARATVEYPLTPGLRKLQFTGRSRMVEAGGRWLIAPRGG